MSRPTVRVAILTGLRHGAASDCLPLLVAHPDIEVALVVLSRNEIRDRAKLRRKKLRKLRRIGLLGGLVGLRLRRWNDGFPGEDLVAIAERLGVPVMEVPRHNCDETRELLRQADVDLALSLGCGLLARSVFSIPRHGTINVHGDVLPRFRGGTSVIWPIYEGVPEAGFTVHEIDRGIDTGRILSVVRFPIRFEASLRETYRVNVAEIRRRVPQALVDVVANYEAHLERAQPQGSGTTYTTPSFRQFLRMLRRHRRLRREQRARRAGRSSSR